jgi:outer membrane murein-binding lipoprotein Lpp
MMRAMGARFAVVAAMLLVAGCSTARPTACRCPQPVAYSDAQIEKITAALAALPAKNILHETMDDYEDERDYLRQCLGEE